MELWQGGQRQYVYEDTKGRYKWDTISNKKSTFPSPFLFGVAARHSGSVKNPMKKTTQGVKKGANC